MSKNIKQVKRGRGRPDFEFNYPKSGKLTINAFVEANPHIQCRLTVYNHVKKLLKSKTLRRTREKIPTGGVGKPMDVFITDAAYRRLQSRKNRKNLLASVPPVDLTPAPAPVNTALVAA